MARPRTDIRERVVRAARHEFLQRGVDATSLRAIARRARSNIGMIYYYFPTKEDLFLAVIEAPYARIVATMGEILGGPAPVRERIRALYRRIGAFAPDEAETFRLVISEAVKSPRLRAKVFARAWHGHLPIVFGALERGKRDADLRANVPTPLLGIVTAAVGILPQIAARAAPLGLAANEALADQLTDLLFDGIGA
ncbi:MAG TPA: helix-turn-helix domain-containing protein [Polyangia bacterium]|nr:helix-turn-helix domain-containing protein [Polyangia bacterium]